LKLTHFGDLLLYERSWKIHETGVFSYLY